MAFNPSFLREVAGSADFTQSGIDIDSRNSVANRASRLTVAGTSTATKIYKYPLFVDRGNQNTKVEETARECIRFTVVKQGGVSLSKSDLENARKTMIGAGIKRTNSEISANSPFAEGARGFVNAATGKLQPLNIQKQLLTAARNKQSKLKGERDALLSGDLGSLGISDIAAGGIAALKVQSGNIKQKATNLEHCFLYMPTSIVYNEGATWSSESIGAMGNAAKQMIRNTSDIGKIMSDFGAGIVAPLAKAAAIGVGGAIAGVFGAVATAVGGSGIVGGIGAATRVAQNPYEEQLFTGIPFRVFNFNFEFIATSETEFAEVQKIITMFRAHSRPTFTIDNEIDGSPNEALYSYPNEFAIEFMHLNDSDVFERNKYLPRLHNCVLTNITTNFAPDGWIAHRKGEPVSIVVQLAFNETKKNTRTDIVSEDETRGGH